MKGGAAAFGIMVRRADRPGRTGRMRLSVCGCWPLAAPGLRFPGLRAQVATPLTHACFGFRPKPYTRSPRAATPLMHACTRRGASSAGRRHREGRV